MKEGRKSRATLWTVVIILILAAVVAAGVFVVSVRPQRRVAKGLMNLSSELVQYRNPVLAEMDLDGILQKWQEGNIQTASDIDVTFSEKQESTLGITVDKLLDRENRLLQAEGDIRLLGKDIGKLQVVMEDRELYLTLPSLSQKSFKADMDTLTAAFNGSILSKLTGWEVPEDYLKFIFGQLTDGVSEEAGGESETTGGGSEVTGGATGIAGGEPEDIQGTLQAARTLLAGAFSIGNVGGSMKWNEVQDYLKEIEIIDTKKKLTIENSWKDIDWDGYEIRISADMVNGLLGRIGQMMGMDNVPESQEIVLEVYLDKNDRIMRIATVQPLTDRENGQEIEFTLDLLGEERTVDTMSMTVYLTESLREESAPEEHSQAESTLGENLQEETAAGEAREGTARETEFTLRFQGLLGEDGCSTELSAEWRPVEGSLSVSCDWIYETKTFHILAEQVKEDDTLSCEAQGNFAEVISGESIKVNVDSLNISKNDKAFCRLSGSYFLEPLNEEIVIPEDSIDIGKYLK